MSYISIKGGIRPEGEISLQGSKNATLPMLAAAVLCRGKVVLENCPDISDVRELLHALECAGVKSSLYNNVLEMDTSEAFPCFFDAAFAEKTRGGVLLLGAFFGRFYEAGMAYPGGCVIGARPIDLHCKVFRELGGTVSLEEDGGYVDDTGIMRMDLTIYTYDKYDMVDIAALNVGDIIVTHAGEVKVASLERNGDCSVSINGDINLVTDECGIFFEIDSNDAKNWYEIGKATIRVSVDFLGTDNIDPELGEVILYPGSFLVGEVKNYNFTPYNTTIRVENGQVIEMTRIYTP